MGHISNYIYWVGSIMIGHSCVDPKMFVPLYNSLVSLYKWPHLSSVVKHGESLSLAVGRLVGN